MCLHFGQNFCNKLHGTGQRFIKTGQTFVWTGQRKMSDFWSNFIKFSGRTFLIEELAPFVQTNGCAVIHRLFLLLNVEACIGNRGICVHQIVPADVRDRILKWAISLAPV